MTAVLLYTEVRGQGDEFQLETRRTVHGLEQQLSQFKATQNTPMLIKTGLQIHSTILETRHLYVYVYNLLSTARGLEIKQYPFKGASIDNKVGRLKKLAESTDYGVGDMLDEIIQLPIRNAYTHNRYAIRAGGIVLTELDYFISYPDLFRVLSKTQVFYRQLTRDALREMEIVNTPGTYKYPSKDGKMLTLKVEEPEDGCCHMQFDGFAVPLSITVEIPLTKSPPWAV